MAKLKDLLWFKCELGQLWSLQIHLFLYFKNEASTLRLSGEIISLDLTYLNTTSIPKSLCATVTRQSG